MHKGECKCQPKPANVVERCKELAVLLADEVPVLANMLNNYARGREMNEKLSPSEG